jgi:hypothetical protein
MSLNSTKCAQRKLWRTVLYILLLQGVASFVIIPTETKFLSRVQQQLPILRLNTSVSSSTDTNDISNTEQPKRSNEQRRMGELTKSEQTAYDILCELSKSEYSFRIVVVGKNGSAILESTVPCLGPKIKILQSPSTGTTLNIVHMFFSLHDTYACQRDTRIDLT